MVKVRQADEFALLRSSESRGAGPLARKDDHCVSGLDAVKERILDVYGRRAGDGRMTAITSGSSNH
jgi:hypothetical protein